VTLKIASGSVLALLTAKRPDIEWVG